MKIIKIFSSRSTFKTQFNVNLDSIQIPSANGPEPVARKLCYIEGKTFDLCVRQCNVCQSSIPMWNMTGMRESHV